MMTPLRQRLAALFTTSGFRGPVLTLLSGSGIVLVLAYLAQPVLTRLYPPSSFGVSDYFITLLTVLMAFASWRYEDAIMQPESEREAAGLVGLAVGLLTVTVVATALLLPWRTPIAAWLGIPDLAPWLVLVPPTLLVMRISKLAELWLTRARRFRLVSAGTVTQTLTMISGRIGAGAALTTSPGGLIGGFALGHLASALLLGTLVVRQMRRYLRSIFDVSLWRRLARRYRRFALFSTPSSLLNIVLVRLPYLLLPIYFTTDVLGFFGRAFVALAVPLSIIGGAVAQVFFVQAAEAQESGTLSTLTTTVHRRLVMIGLFPALLLLLAGPDLFEFVFGDVWRTAGVYVRYVAPWLFLASVASPLTRLFDVLERQRLDLGASLIMFVLLAAALLGTGPSGDVLLTLGVLGGVGALLRVGHLVLLLRLADVSLGDAVRPYLRYALMAAPGIAITGIAVALNARPLVTTLVAALGGLVYLALLLWRDQLLADRRSQEPPTTEKADAQ
ncbi:MAG: oligosaccharide flippase family protein [Bacteroidetes bacterium]|jgi:O-antigen/teichoic acid export membrane protein|nr:oligosaccharide flippase family protein [Bacteroidota bacterium]